MSQGLKGTDSQCPRSLTRPGCVGGLWPWCHLGPYGVTQPVWAQLMCSHCFHGEFLTERDAAQGPCLWSWGGRGWYSWVRLSAGALWFPSPLIGSPSWSSVTLRFGEIKESLSSPRMGIAVMVNTSETEGPNCNSKPRIYQKVAKCLYFLHALISDARQLGRCWDEVAL